MIDVYQAAAIIAVAMAGTVITRVVPFALFGGKKEMPQLVRQIATRLPAAIIAILVVYCVKDVNTGDMTKLSATVVSVISVVLLHLWRREILISIGGGTILYMVLLRCI